MRIASFLLAGILVNLSAELDKLYALRKIGIHGVAKYSISTKRTLMNYHYLDMIKPWHKQRERVLRRIKAPGRHRINVRF